MADIFNQETTNTEGSSSKKALYISIGVLAFLLLAGLVFYVVVIKGNGSIAQGIKNVLPFGEETPDATQTPGNAGGNQNLEDVTLGQNAARPRFFKVADGPVSGFVLKKLQGNSEVVRYALREDGDVYDFDLNTRSGRLLVNNSIPRVYESVWDASGQSALFRTLDDQDRIVTVLGKISANTATTTANEAPAVMTEEFLPNNIAFASAGSAGGFVYTIPIGTNLSVNTLDQKGIVTAIFSSPFTEWLPEWPSKGTVTIATKPSQEIGGYLMTIDPSTGSIAQTLSDKKGLTARMSPDGKKILAGETKSGAMTLSVINRATHEESAITPSTLPEKCAWNASSTTAYCGIPENPPRGAYPDDWYQGVLSFSDVIWKLDANTKLFAPIAIPNVEEARANIDAISLAVTPDEQYLFFINKADGALWGLDLSTPLPSGNSTEGL